MAVELDLKPGQPAFLKAIDSATVRYPANPEDGDRIIYRVTDDDLTPITFDAGTNLVEGAIASPFNLIQPLGGLELVFSNKTAPASWWVMNELEVPTALLVLDGTGWAPLTLDAIYTKAEFTLGSSRYLTFDDANDQFSFNIPGTYEFVLNGTFEHNSSNQGRTTNVRFWNATDGVSIGPPFIIATGRNAEATPFTVYDGFVDIDSSTVGKLIQVEFGGGDSYSLVDFDYLNLSIGSQDLSLLEQAT